MMVFDHNSHRFLSRSLMIPMILLFQAVKRMRSSITMLDVSIYKFTLAAFGAAVVAYFPVVLSWARWIYLLIAVVLWIMMMRHIFAHQTSHKRFFDSVLDRMRKMSFGGRVVFEMYVIAMAILIIKLIPSILVIVDPVRFVIVAAAGTGYLIGIITKQQ